MFRARYSFKPERSEELKLSTGDTVYRLEDVGNGWVLARNERTGGTGLCPKDYLEHTLNRCDRMTRLKKRVSNIYVNLTQLPKPTSDASNIPFTVPSPDSPPEEAKDGKYILPGVRTQTQRCTRLLIGLLVGAIFGSVIFAALSLSYNYSLLISGSIAGGITLAMTIFMVISPHARCVAAMMSMTVFTHKGRAAFLSLIPGLLLAGPVLNMQSNINEAASSAACIVEIVLNQSLAINNQLLEPITRQQENLQLAAKIIEEKTVDIKSSINSFRSTIDNLDLNGTGNTFNGTGNKICEQQLSAMYSRCRSLVQDGRQACRNAVRGRPRRSAEPRSPTRIKRFSWGGRKCKKSVCDAGLSVDSCGALNSSNICRLFDLPSVRTVVRTVTSTFNDLDDLISLHLNSSGFVDIRGNTSFDPIMKVRELRKNFEMNLNIAIKVFTIINKILILFLIYAFVDACVYLRRYLRNTKYDNIYIGGHFRYLNTRLKVMNKSKSVLPLQVGERERYIDQSTPRLTRKEIRSCRRGFSMLLLQVILATVVILFDFALFYLLKLVKDNGDVDVLVTGGIKLAVQVEGKGPFADIFRAVVNGVSVSKQFEDVLNFQRCLPQASWPKMEKVYYISALYILGVIFVLMEAYGLRLRHRIIGFFFPEREAERVHYLYRHILLKRVVRKEEQKKLNLLADKWEVCELSGKSKEHK